MNKLTAIILFFFLIFTSCNNQTETKTSEKRIIKTLNIFQAGKVYQNLKCRKDSTQKYTAYFPENYNQTKKIPIIVVFDAHARAKLTIEKFKNASNKFGYLIIVSENIKNGLKTVDYSVNTLFDDIFSKFKIDKKRVYTAGFSGGARIANSVAIYKGGITGVIACSGGLPQQGIKIKNKYDFVGIVGIKDFNYQEIKTLNEAFDKEGFNNKLITFNGQHNWPDFNLITDALEFLEIAAMKRKIIPVNDNIVRLYTERNAEIINKFIVNGKNYKAYLLYNSFLKSLNGLYDISEYEKSYNVLLKNKEIKQQINLETQTSENEAIKQQEFISLFKQLEFNKLKQNIIKLQSKVKKQNENYYENRLLNYVEMLCYIFTNNALQTNDFKTFNQLITIFELINKKNADKEYFKACKYAIDKNNIYALQSLNKAVEYGFYDKEKIINSTYFKNLKSNDEFMIILNKINSD